MLLAFTNNFPVAGVLKPKAATLLIGSIRKKYPSIPIHVHTHDSAGTGVASMVACAQAGADAVDSATDSMSGMTSQPSIGAILASLEGSEISTGLDPQQVRAIDSYWAQTRLTYSPFEAGLTGPDSGKLFLLFTRSFTLSFLYSSFYARTRVVGSARCRLDSVANVTSRSSGRQLFGCFSSERLLSRINSLGSGVSKLHREVVTLTRSKRNMSPAVFIPEDFF